MVDGSTWQLQEAKAKLSEVVRRARSEGPQTITVHGQKAVVVVDGDDYERDHPASEHRSRTQFGDTLMEVLLNAPKVYTDEEIDELFSRDPGDVGRDVVFDD